MGDGVGGGGGGIRQVGGRGAGLEGLQDGVGALRREIGEIVRRDGALWAL